MKNDEMDGADATHGEASNAYKLSIGSYTTPRVVRQ
jgi:hypothetical protein